jgi:hypothetical protein
LTDPRLEDLYLNHFAQGKGFDTFEEMSHTVPWSMFADDYRQIAKDVVGLLYGYVKVEVIYHARI